MARLVGVSPWHQTMPTYLPQRSTPQVTGLGLWSVGIVLAHSCGLPTVAARLAYLLGGTETTGREHLRDWERNAPTNVAPTAGARAAGWT